MRNVDGKVSWFPRQLQSPRGGCSYKSEQARAVSFPNGAFPQRAGLPVSAGCIRFPCLPNRASDCVQRVVLMGWTVISSMNGLLRAICA
jgi:hypothetical protein